MRYITAADLACKCGRCGGQMGFSAAGVQALNALQTHLGAELQINSGWRCPFHIEERDKDEPGPHGTDSADNVCVDVQIHGTLLYRLLRLCPQHGFVGIGLQQKLGSSHSERFVHLDRIPPPGTDKRPRPWVWTY